MVRARVGISEGLSEAEQLREARNANYKDAGRDVLADALASPIQARNSNLSRNQPDYEPPRKWRDYSEMPAARWTHN